MASTSDALVPAHAVIYDYVDTQISSSLDCPICRALDTTKSCPIDRTRLDSSELVRAPRIIEHLCDELSVYCSNKGSGCNAVLERSSLERHLRKDCVARPVVAKKGKVVDHAEGPGLGSCTRANDDDDTLDGECDACGDLLATEDIASVLKRKQIASIVPSASKDVDSPVITSNVLRFLFRHGCMARVARSRMLDEHLDLTCPYEPIKDYLARQDARLVELESDNLMLAARCANMENDMKEMRQLMLGLRANMGVYFPALAIGAGPGIPGHTPPGPSLPSPALQAPVSPAVSSRVSPASPQPDPFAYLPLPEPASASSSAVYPVDAPTPTLPSAISSLQTAMSTLSATVASLETRQSTNLLNETMRIQDDVQSIRAVVHGIRMQMHYIMMELGRLTGTPTNATNSATAAASGGPSSLGLDPRGIRRTSSSGSSSNESDIEEDHHMSSASSRIRVAPWSMSASEAGHHRFFGPPTGLGPMITPVPAFQQYHHARVGYPPMYNSTGSIGQSGPFAVGGIKL
ncbi:hypothetical protein OIV83_001261 [Microbotryomycetes sp. JL201]|nr:hypothetical protein OIV83_001261 [Microbotryomycetes sp. JL201]